MVGPSNRLNREHPAEINFSNSILTAVVFTGFQLRGTSDVNFRNLRSQSRSLFKQPKKK